MAAKDEDFARPRLISWPLRVTAGLMLAYMALLLVSELTPWPYPYNLFVPDTGVLTPGLFALVYLLNLALLMLWCGFANRALGQVAQPKLKSQPVMAALWFITPGAFAFMPWPVVRELYMASREPLAWEGVKAPITGWWWCTRVISFVGVWWLTGLADPGDEGFVRSLVLQAIIGAELVLQIVIITRMTRWQTQHLKPSVADVF